MYSSVLKMIVLVKLILLAFVGGIVCGDYFYSNGTNYYFSAPMKKNWFQAQRFCHANGMHLVSIHTEEENRILLDVIFMKFKPKTTDDHFWSSGTDMGQTDLEFYWTESGHATLFTNWLDSNPAKDRRGCILLHAGGYSYKWYDQSCDGAFYFICQDQLITPYSTKRKMCFNNSAYFESG